MPCKSKFSKTAKSKACKVKREDKGNSNNTNCPGEMFDGFSSQ